MPDVVLVDVLVVVLSYISQTLLLQLSILGYSYTVMAPYCFPMCATNVFYFLRFLTCIGGTSLTLVPMVHAVLPSFFNTTGIVNVTIVQNDPVTQVLLLDSITYFLKSENLHD